MNFYAVMAQKLKSRIHYIDFRVNTLRKGVTLSPLSYGLVSVRITQKQKIFQL